MKHAFLTIISAAPLIVRHAGAEINNTVKAVARLALVLMGCGICHGGANKVLIIGMDGCRPDSLLAAKAPNIDKLWQNGAFSFHAKTDPVTVSAPCWTSMLTGSWSTRHGIVGSDLKAVSKVPHLFQRIKAQNPEIRTAAIVNWPPLKSLLTSESADVVQSANSDGSVADLVCETLAHSAVDIMFVQFDDIDHAGHASGYGPHSSAYIESIETADGLVGKVMKSLESRQSFRDENWLVLLSADHGGIGNSHGRDTPQEATVFLIICGQSVTKGELYSIPAVVDVAVTAMAHLGIVMDPTWELDGKIQGLKSTQPTNAPATANTKRPPVPDLTQGGKPDGKERWTLGATGARGWFWSWTQSSGVLNTDARQILITEVAKGSPADGVLEIDDVVTGLNGRAFEGDARLLFCKAVTEAETESKGGVLKLVRWRAGKTENVQLKLQVLGTYAPTAPYGCAKSKRIFEQGCEAIARRGFKDKRGNVQINIANDMNALALVASGREEYRPLVAEYARKVAESTPGGHKSWGYAYETLFLAEYVLATKDEAVMPGLRRLSLDIARGASNLGTWGHSFAQTSGILSGYGCMNQPGIPLTLAMVLAREAGVKDPDLDKTITKASVFLRQWVNKGAIPYGDSPEAWPWHDDNGKCSGAAVLFDLLGDREAAAFYSRMGTAAYAERESGHTGDYFSILWALPGVSRCGPAATSAYFKEASWYYDLARAWDGSCEFVPIRGQVSYVGWDCTGSYLLGYALPLKSLYLTGRKQGVAPVLSAKEVAETIAAGRDFSFADAERKVWFANRNTEALLAGLSSWSPAVRQRSSQALGLRKGNELPQILKLLASTDRNSRYGACEALAYLGPKADRAATQARALLSDKDPWLGMLAAKALPNMSQDVRVAAVPDLLRAALIKDTADRRQRLAGEVGKALFKLSPGTREPKPILSQSLDGVDRPLLYAVLKDTLANEDGLIRGLAAGIYPLLSAEDAKALLPEIVEATRKNAPSGEMFRYGIRFAGLDLLAQLRIREGMALCGDMIEEFGRGEWGFKWARVAGPLTKYGGAAKDLLPPIRVIQQKMLATRQEWASKKWNFAELDPDLQIVAKLIAAIEADKNPTPVQSIEEFTGKKARP